MSIQIDAKAAAKRVGTLRRLAEAVHVSFYTMRGIAYGGKTTSIETLYEMAHAAGEVRIHGPKGSVVVRPENTKERRPLLGLPIRGLPAKVVVA